MVALQARAKEAHDKKDDDRNILVDGVKTNLRYAENTGNLDDGKLKLIGWSGRRPPTQLTPPGQARALVSPDRGEGWIALKWKANGGGLSSGTPGTRGGCLNPGRYGPFDRGARVGAGVGEAVRALCGGDE
uniref:Uncharacterized protein n=1 Tax=Candidatus Kentrum sp. TUN TaxID=2126343 RepID=A0A450ZLY8_9GAMM|nr:MAG: hypothetical protein BECKTUN1418F_GA0071002_105711 [Candidatus Kentron sp. TUN]VFK59938.1 MAG: hypothetical protein BECKTUN1418E_GA0071001_10557 [Candidatus Kentron sp. TUN]